MARRLLAAFSFTASLALALLSSQARAGATVDLLFVGLNGAPIAATNTITAPVGDTLTMAIRMRNDEPLSLSIFSLNYDLDGDDELDVVAAFQWLGVSIGKSGTAFYGPVAPLQPSTATFVGSFQGVSSNFAAPRLLPPVGGVFAGGYQMGTIVWKVNAGVNNDGADIISGILDVGVDGFFDAAFNTIDTSVLFNAATVNIPEPGTAALVSLGLLGFALATRCRRR